MYRDDWPIIIICPSSLRYNWKEEILNWMRDIVNPSDIHLMTMGRESVYNNKKIYIVSYELSTKIAHQFLDRNIGIAIVDEAHYLKSWNSQRSLSLVPVIS